MGPWANEPMVTAANTTSCSSGPTGLRALTEACFRRSAHLKRGLSESIRRAKKVKASRRG